VQENTVSGLELKRAKGFPSGERSRRFGGANSREMWTVTAGFYSDGPAERRAKRCLSDEERGKAVTLVCRSYTVPQGVAGDQAYFRQKKKKGKGHPKLLEGRVRGNTIKVCYL